MYYLGLNVIEQLYKKNSLICFLIHLQERRDGGRRLGDHECDGRRSR